MSLQARLGRGPGRRGTPVRVIALGLLVASSCVASCGGGEPASGEVVLYTSMPDEVVERLEGVIERRFPDLDGNLWVSMGSGISLTVVRARTADLEERIADEIETGGVKADVIWLAEPSPYENYKDMGLLARFEPQTDAPIPSDYVDADGFYVAGRIISMVLAWDTSVRPQGLADWPDLLQLEHSAFPGPESGAARATIKALIDKYGDDFFSTLASRGGVTVPSNGAARDGVVAGTYPVVAVLDFMAREAKAAGSAVDFAYPEGGTVLIPSPVAITTTARNPDAAEAVVDFILSKPGQKIMVQIGSFYPVRGDVAPPAGAPPLDSIPALDVDWKMLNAELEKIDGLWEASYGGLPGSG